MAEENEKKPKRRTTLIKHRKTDPPAPESKSKPEKKTVVVVRRKKTIKVKRSSSKGAVDQKNTDSKQSDRPSRPGYLGSSPREPSPFDVDKTTKPRRAEKEKAQRPKTETRARTSSTEKARSGQTSEARPSRTGTRAPFRDRPQGRSAEARSATFRKKDKKQPEGDRLGSIPEKGDESKHGAKKFYKARKKPSYQKRKNEEHIDKIQPIKKKTVRRVNPVPSEISILEAITVSELAKKMNLKASELIGKLMSMGMMVTINQQIDSETAAILADEYGCKVNVVSLYDETVIEEQQDREEDLKQRPPVVTIMGHVDHGKTKLLDAIRTANVVDSEAGGITQHIGAYTVELPQGRIAFLDTPGHEAFTLMRARGAQITDIVVIVVAADDGVMPQTVEAINHAKEAKVPIIIAINKIDLPNANTDRIKQQLADYDLMPEEWGGHALFSEVSALKKIGIDGLLDNILLQSEMLELKANYSCRAQGHVVESKIDQGRGMVATVLIQKGTLMEGDSFIAGIYPGRVRAMFDDKGERIIEASPSIPVEILGFTGLPNAGDPFHVTESEKAARQIGSKRQELKKMENARNVSKITLDNLYDQIKQGEVQELKVIVKGDVHGSVEALQAALERLSTEDIRLTVIHASAGAINDNDVLIAAASNAIIIGFHVRPTPSAQALADREKIEIRKYNIIYDVVEDIRDAMEGLLAPELKEETIGMAEVRNTFKIPKVGLIAGCYISSGKIRRGAQAHVVRDGIVVYTGKIASLKRFKDDAKEVESGFECGIGIENFNDVKNGDNIEAFEIKEYAKKLTESSRDAGNQKTED